MLACPASRSCTTDCALSAFMRIILAATASCSCPARAATKAEARSAGSIAAYSLTGGGFLFEHDLFRKPVPTFQDHALSDCVDRVGRLGTARGLHTFDRSCGGDLAQAGRQIGVGGGGCGAGGGIDGLEILLRGPPPLPP